MLRVVIEKRLRLSVPFWQLFRSSFADALQAMASQVKPENTDNDAAGLVDVACDETDGALDLTEYEGEAGYERASPQLRWWRKQVEMMDQQDAREKEKKKADNEMQMMEWEDKFPERMRARTIRERIAMQEADQYCASMRSFDLELPSDSEVTFDTEMGFVKKRFIRHKCRKRTIGTFASAPQEAEETKATTATIAPTEVDGGTRGGNEKKRKETHIVALPLKRLMGTIVVVDD